MTDRTSLQSVELDGSADLTSAPRSQVKVTVVMWVNQVTNIDSVSGTFKIDVDVEYQWLDMRVVTKNPEPELVYDEFIFRPEIDNPEEQIWQPNVEVINIDDGDAEGGEPTYIVKKLPAWDFPLVTMERTYQVTLNSPMQLRHFPYDEQVLSFYCRSIDQSKEELIFEIPPESRASYVDNLAHDVHFEEWDMIAVTAFARDHLYEYVARSEGVDQAVYSEFRLSFRLKRRMGFYGIKVITPTLVVMLMELGAFFAEPDDLGTRISVSLTLLLTAVAFQFVVGELLPKISYNTIIDYLFIVMYILITLSYAQNIIVFQLSKSLGSEDLELIDFTCAGVYLLCLLVIIVLYLIIFPLYFQAPEALTILNSQDRLKKYNIEWSDAEDDDDDRTVVSSM